MFEAHLYTHNQNNYICCCWLKVTLDESQFACWLYTTQHLASVLGARISVSIFWSPAVQKKLYVYNFST